MRCGTATTIYAFSGPSGTGEAAYTVLTLGADGASCPVSSYVVLTPSEFDNATASPFRLTLAEAGAISTAIVSVWALAWAVRSLVRVIRDTDAPPVHD